MEVKEPSFNPQSTPPPDEPGMLPPQPKQMLPPPPKPWETAVRMRILGKNNVGFGSGTIIHSTADESIVLTAARYFRVTSQTQDIRDKGIKEVSPSEFPFMIMIDLFDGKLTATKPAQVHFLEAVEGKLVDYDLDRNVALVRIRPGRRLSASPVVSPRWRPQEGKQVLTVGCSEGHDATAWHSTITGTMVLEDPDYVAIECETAPKQGRTGGGLFTTDGFVAGVCSNADAEQKQGIYAAQGRSIVSWTGMT